jgi:glycerophosphoryl diester phosphodiesterase
MSRRIVLPLACVLLACPWALGADEVPPAVAQAARKVRQVIGHRGSCADRPENTLSSFRRAIEAGAAITEVDVRTTKDGVLVLLHDAELSRVTGVKGRVGDLTLDELKKLDAGSWFDPSFKGERIPTLHEALELCKGKIGVMIDLKETGAEYAEKITALVRKHGEPAKTVLGVRSVEHARQFKKLLPEAKQLGLVPAQSDIEAFAAAGVPMIRLWPKWLSDPALVPRVRKLGLALHLGAGTGKREEVLPLLAHEPESLSSDDPARLIRTLAELGK